MTNVREATNRLLEMIDDGLLDRDTVINACVSYMSEADVADMCECNEFFYDDDDEEETAVPGQYRLIVNLDERGEVSVSVYAIEENGEDSDEPVWHLPPTPWDEASDIDGSESFNPTDVACIRLYLSESGLVDTPLSDLTVLRENEDPEME